MANFAVFVYGTLQPGHGFANCERHCQGIIKHSPAEVWGRLYDLPYGYPMLAIPPEHVLAIGSTDPLADLDLLVTWQARPVPEPTPPPGDWHPIAGVILEFNDPAQRLPGLDALEGFHPPGECDYHRVLVRPLGPASLPAWTYIAPHGALPASAVRCGNRWP